MSKRKHSIEAHFQQGVRLHRAGRLADGVQACRQVLAATPTHAQTHHMMDVPALQSGRDGAALASIDRAIALRPATAMYAMDQVNPAEILLALGDTTVVMACLDLIVTSDTSIDHLAAASGRPAWVALQHVRVPRWQLGREDCPWYPLFRRRRRGDWEDVRVRIAAATADLVRV